MVISPRGRDFASSRSLSRLNRSRRIAFLPRKIWRNDSAAASLETNAKRNAYVHVYARKRRRWISVTRRNRFSALPAHAVPSHDIPVSQILQQPIRFSPNRPSLQLIVSANFEDRLSFGTCQERFRVRFARLLFCNANRGPIVARI